MLEGTAIDKETTIQIGGNGVEEGGNPNAIKDIDDKTIFGHDPVSQFNRKGCDIVFPNDGRFALNHFYIRFDDTIDNYVLKDLDKGSGTFIKIQHPLIIKNEMFITFGDSHLVLKLPELIGNNKQKIILKFLDGPKKEEKLQVHQSVRSLKMNVQLQQEGQIYVKQSLMVHLDLGSNQEQISLRKLINLQQKMETTTLQQMELGYSQVKSAHQTSLIKLLKQGLHYFKQVLIDQFIKVLISSFHSVFRQTSRSISTSLVTSEDQTLLRGEHH